MRTSDASGIGIPEAGWHRHFLMPMHHEILRTNPNDNPGVRYLILGIRMGMSHAEFEEKFDRGGFWDSDIHEWFSRNQSKFPEEFDWWEKAIEGEE